MVVFIKCYQNDQIKKYEMGVKSQRTHDKIRNACRVLVGKLEEKRLLGRSRCKLEDRTIKTGYEDADWIELAGDAVQ